MKDDIFYEMESVITYPLSLSLIFSHCFEPKPQTSYRWFQNSWVIKPLRVL